MKKRGAKARTWRGWTWCNQRGYIVYDICSTRKETKYTRGHEELGLRVIRVEIREILPRSKRRG